MIEAQNDLIALPFMQRALLLRMHMRMHMRMQTMRSRHRAETQERVDNMLGQLGAPTAPPHLESFIYALVHRAACEPELLCIRETEGSPTSARCWR